jgi:hypothetical protein
LFSSEGAPHDALHRILDRVSAKIPHLSAITIKKLHRGPTGSTVAAPGLDGLSVVTSYAAEKALQSIDNRADTTRSTSFELPEPRMSEVETELTVRACNGMFLRIWEALLAEAEEPERSVLLRRSTHYLSATTTFLDSILESAGRSASHARPDLSLQERRRLIAEDLVRGKQSPDSLHRDDIPVCTAYAVIVIRGHRPLRHLYSAPEWQWLVANRSGWTAILVPRVDLVAGTPPDPMPHVLRVAECLGLDRPAGLALPRTIAEIPAGITDAQETAATLGNLGYEKPGLYQLDDILLEAILRRSGELAGRLASRLAPVASSTPYLIETLAAFLDSDCDRRELARRLYIHPNTLSHRLRRVSELTGLSLNKAQDLCLLNASLVALKVMGEGNGGPSQPMSTFEASA